MKKLIYITFIGLLGLLFSCEKDGDQIFLLDNPVAPTIVSMPDLTLERNNGTDTLEFVGTPLDPGFVASTKYFLEACANGNNFSNVISIQNNIEGTLFKITVSDLNGILLKKFPADEASSVDFRIRAQLVVDAGTGAPGAADGTFDYNSTTETASVTLYGLPRLDILNSGIDQKIESALGNGEYMGYIKLEETKPFTLFEPDNEITYGGSDGVLAADGAAINPVSTGWHQLSANLNDLTYELLDFRIGLIGDATPNKWDAPDQKMEYDPQSGLWSITLDLVVGTVKFRVNDDWSGSVNLGIGDDDHPEYTLDNLWNNSSSQNIPIDAAGNYTITLSIGSKYSATITKN
ncbi:SusE domain-containing protein [Prolixibacteraceae bacterium Z1-6]|uniref:SusE domain-containing protein n=1 Tax=Draconibacterium aestuarii TaxID=2998507 RepID=A0A9X3J7K1_9BACT|nr:SusE domain-containing protein [Prolixibacteraceae bacterium Z1-6]